MTTRKKIVTARRNNRKPRRTPRCDCGQPATCMTRVTVLRPDLQSEVKITLFLCDDCYILEKMLDFSLGRQPPKARSLGGSRKR